jgi:hypothetical protein
MNTYNIMVDAEVHTLFSFAMHHPPEHQTLTYAVKGRTQYEAEELLESIIAANDDIVDYSIIKVGVIQ